MRFSGRETARLFQVSILAIASLFFSTAAIAQVPTSGNLFFGYSFESADSTSLGLSNSSRPNLNGWEASFEGKIFPWVGFVADFVQHFGSESFQTTQAPNGASSANVDGHELTALFGPRVGAPIGGFRPFAEALFGVGHISTSFSGTGPDNFVKPSDTAFATAIGGGLDYKIIKPIALRFQGDYVQTRFFGTTQNNVRFSTGIVLRF